jgi:hypothetical protein
MFDQADAIIAALALGFDHADDIAAALVLCLAAVYSVRAIWVWRGTYLDSQGRQIFKLIANEDKNPVPTPK